MSELVSEFVRMCDIWKAFWTVLGEEIVEKGGKIDMLERLAKKELRPAIRQLAWTIIQFATASRPAPVPVSFDPKKAHQIWKSAKLWENSDYPYSTFTLENHQNQTRLEIGITHLREGVQLQMDMVTLDCPALNHGGAAPHQRLMHLSLGMGVIQNVIYDSVRGHIVFELETPPGTKPRSLWISDRGYVVFSEWKT